MYCDLNLIKILVFFQQERNDATAQAGRAALAAAGGAGAGAAINIPGLPHPPRPRPAAAAAAAAFCEFTLLNYVNSQHSTEQISRNS